MLAELKGTVCPQSKIGEKVIYIKYGTDNLEYR